MYEQLYDNGWFLGGDPFDAYIILSHRECTLRPAGVEEGCGLADYAHRAAVRAKLRRWVLRNVRHFSRTVKPQPDRQQFAETIKDIAKVNTAMTETYKRLTGKFETVRPYYIRLKREQPRMFAQFKRLYPAFVLGTPYGKRNRNSIMLPKSHVHR